MSDFYTPLDTAKEELLRRWEDVDLKERVRTYLKGDVPDFFEISPRLALFKNIMTPNDENGRVAEMSRATGLDVLGLEFTHDKFVAFNLDKYIFGMLFFKMGMRPDGRMQVYKKKVVDIQTAQGKPFTELSTVWGQNLISFHHGILDILMPEFKGNVYDLSDWIERNGGKARLFYSKIFALFIRNCILVENVQFPGEEIPHANGTQDESRFTTEVILPAFDMVESHFGIRPLVVQLAPEDYASDPTWWHYKGEFRVPIEEYIAMHKEKARETKS